MSRTINMHTQSPSTVNSKVFDEQTKAEMLVSIQLYLDDDPLYKDVAAKLKENIEKYKVLPARYDVEGNMHSQTLASFLSKVKSYGSSLTGIFERLCQLQTKVSAPPVQRLPIRFFTSRRTALDRKLDENFYVPPKIQSVICNRPSPEMMHSLNPLKFLQCRELGRTMPLPPRQIFRKEYIYTLNRHTRILGHLSSIFCVAFDRSGLYIFTGADDNLIKIWDVQRCLLRFTFRGHVGEISDLSISHENSLLASGSVDKTVRVWCLRKGTTLRVYKGHSATVNSIAFIPLLNADDDWRWLVSAGNDCSVVFHRYNERTKEFIDAPIKFHERATGGARIISSSHSPGGNFVIMGDTHQAIIMYKLGDINVERLYEFTAHSDRVDTLIWGHRSLRFVSGSKDGTAKSWFMQGGQWKSIELIVPSTEIAGVESNNIAAERQLQSAQPKRNSNSYKVTMLTWSLEDDLVISIGSDYLLRTWDWKTGRQLAKYAGHQNETFALMAHPLHRELIISAGHDGLIIVWDIYTGKHICRHRNENNNREAVAIFDMAISNDGATVSCVDSMGNLSIYGVSNNQPAMLRPYEQFFSTDYRLLQIDPDGRATDEDTGLLPELLTPPFFVTSDGNLHSELEQKLIPGNDIKSDDIIKPCAWLKRDIVRALCQSALDKYRGEQAEYNRQERLEFERSRAETIDSEPVFLEKIKKSPKINKRTGGQLRSSTQHRRTEVQQLAEFIRQNQPRYILDDEWTDDENDHSFSLGSDEELEEPDEHFIRDEHQEMEESTSENGKIGEEVDEFAEEDEDDSDYEIGGRERETVFRDRSSWTVTGKRKRRPPTMAENEQEQQSSSSQERAADEQETRFQSERLRNRVSRANLTGQSQQSIPRPNARKIRTRRTAFIVSSDGEDVDGDWSLPDDSELAMKKTTNNQRNHVNRPRDKALKIKTEEGEEDEENAEELLITKKSENVRKKKGKKINRRRVNRTISSAPSKNGGSSSFQDEEEELFQSTGYPQWMRNTSLRRFPFFPQIGDLVVYFLQGHRAYLEELERRAIKVPSAFLIQSALDAQEFCYVDELTYITIGKSPPIYVALLRLARTKYGKRIGSSFHICCHDMEHVIDFLVLKQHYDASMAMNLAVGDRIESIIDDKIYTGMVIKRDAYEEDYPNSEWSSVSVQWDNGEDDRFSPWDLQKSARIKKTAIPANPNDLTKLGKYNPVPGDWLVIGQESASRAEQLYLERVSCAIGQLSQLEAIAPFREPVDLSYYRTYMGFVNYPIDLRTIQERIHNHFYRRSLSLLHDMQYLARNASLYNDSGSEITSNAQALVETIFVYMENWHEKDPAELFDRIKCSGHKLASWRRKLHPTDSKNFTSPGEQIALRITRTRASGGGESSSSALKESKATPLWITECQDMIEQLLNSFMNGVNNRDMNNLAYEFISNLRICSDSLLSNKCQFPESFFEELRQFLVNQKNKVVDSESRRSKTYQAILNMESQLENKQQPILAKYRRMTAEKANTDRIAENSRHKRAAALSAQALWRHISNNHMDDQILGIERRTSNRVRMREANSHHLYGFSSIEGPSEAADYSDMDSKPILRHRKRTQQSALIDESYQSTSQEQSSTERPIRKYSQSPIKKPKVEIMEPEEDFEQEESSAYNSDSDYIEEEETKKEVKGLAPDGNFDDDDDDGDEEKIILPQRTQSGRLIRPSKRSSFY